MQALNNLFWFSTKPSTWPHVIELFVRKFRTNHDTPKHAKEATAWAATKSAAPLEALQSLGIIPEDATTMSHLPQPDIEEGMRRQASSSIKMGGAGSISLLYTLIEHTGAKNVVETGVAYGWSSLAILSAFKNQGTLREARLASVDMPYPQAGSEVNVGIVIPESLKSGWMLIRKPDSVGLKDAIASFNGTQLDLCHYDSDKSWWGRQFAFPILWKALRKGGVFVCDDIHDNMAFANFVESGNLAYAVTKNDDKYIGIIVK